MSLTLHAEIVIDASEVTPESMALLRDKLDDFSPVLTDIGSLIEEGLAKNFETQGYGSWAALSASTQASKERGDYAGMPPLVRTGDLKAALTERDAPGHKFIVEPNSLTVGVLGDAIPYAGYLDSGTGRMPARMLITVTPGTLEKIVQAILDWLSVGDAARVYIAHGVA